MQGNRSQSTLPSDYRNDDITVRLIARFRQMIAAGNLAPGGKLPAERDLSANFNVSRNSIRQALKVLEVMGVVRQRVGSGTYLSQDCSSTLTEAFQSFVILGAISHEELFEARLIMEPELAARAAANATLNDLRKLEQSIAAMENAGTDAKEAIEADMEFHSIVFEAAGNRVCQAMFSVLHRALLESISQTSQYVVRSHTLRFHKAICQALFERKPEEARRIMREHIEDARSVMRRSVVSPAKQGRGLTEPRAGKKEGDGVRDSARDPASFSVETT